MYGSGCGLTATSTLPIIGCRCRRTSRAEAVCMKAACTQGTAVAKVRLQIPPGATSMMVHIYSLARRSHGSVRHSSPQRTDLHGRRVVRVELHGEEAFRAAEAGSSCIR